MMAGCASPCGSGRAPLAPWWAGRPRPPGPGEQPVLVVRVEQRAVDGAATAAVLRAVEEALGARRGAARLVSGVRSRTKVVEVDPAPENAAERLSALLGPAVAPD